MNIRRSAVSMIAPCLLVVALTACGGSKNNATSNSGDASEQSGAAVGAISTAASTTAASSSVRTAGSASATAGGTVSPTAAQSIPVGQTVRAGDLDLTVDTVRAVDARQYDRTNKANVAVDVQLVNSRGSNSINFSAALDVKMVDTQGVSHDPDLFCGMCPDQLNNSSVAKSGQTEGTIYFDMQGATTKQLEYQRFSSDPKVVVALPAVQGAASATRSKATADPNSRDCQYATALTTASLAFLTAVFGQLDLAGATPGPSGAPALTADQANKAVTSLVQGANQASSALKKVSPPPDFKAYHANVIKQFDMLIQQLKDAQKAAAGGDTSTVSALFSGNSALDNLSGIDSAYPELTTRLNACPGLLDSTPTSKP